VWTRTEAREAEVELQEVWQQALSKLNGRISATDLGCWVQAIHPVELRKQRVCGEVPSAMHLEQIRARLQGEISSVLAELLGSGAEIVLSVNKGLRQAPPTPRPLAASGTGGYTFDGFVVGDSNALARGSAWDVAERPGMVYNPLFLYGRVGLGKTHLASAVANQLGRGPYRRVALLSAEAFANDMIRALITNAMDAFRARLRHLDVLIVDDIQFLAGKERMQEEFFHTFNTLHAAGRQIVLACDQAPRSIRGLELPLQSRFESGLTAEIRSPEAPLRLAILAHKAKSLGFELPLEVAQWLASKVVASVRELEGALHRLVAACRCSRRAPDLCFAAEVLRPILRSAPPCSLEQVQRLVAESFRVTADELVQRGGTGRVRVPRQIAMYLARKGTSATYAEIAAGFGGRNHSTVMHAVRCVETRRCREPEFAGLVDRLAEQLAAV
jgi:chromosomal replication initiator protein